MEFYNVKTEQKVELPESGIINRSLVQKNGKRTFAVVGEENGVRLVRFVRKEWYRALQVPERP